MSTLVVYTSKQGNTKTFIDFIKPHLEDDCVITNELIHDVAPFDKILIGSYTWADGKIPVEMKNYIIGQREHFKGKKVYIFGSGLSIYPKFCTAVDSIKKMVTDCGAEVPWTFKFEQRFNEKYHDKDELNRIVGLV